MKKMLILGFIFMVTLAFVIPINAYSNKPADVLIYNLNGSIVYSDSVATNLYRFDVQITKPSNTAKYILFSSLIRDDVYYSTYMAENDELENILTSTNDRFTSMTANNYMYFLRTAPMWNPTATNLLGVSFYIRNSSGANAQLIVQDLIENYMYLYVDSINTSESAVVTAFFQRYNTDNFNSGYSEGYNDAKSELYPIYYWEGHQDGYELAESIVGPEQWDAGYDAGLTADMDVKPLFDNLISFIGSVFNLTIFPGVTIGVLVSIPISFALFKWFMRMFGGK